VICNVGNVALETTGGCAHVIRPLTMPLVSCLAHIQFYSINYPREKCLLNISVC